MTIENCPGCGGIWFDAGELNRLVSVIPKFDPSQAKPAQVPCVGCGETMELHTFPQTDVEIDRCPACQGIWLDRSEFEALKEQLADFMPEVDAGWHERAQASIDEAAKKEQDRTRCRDCTATLSHVRRGRVTLDRCPDCGGTWFDVGEITAVLGVSRSISLKNAPKTELKCLRCPDETLVDAEYPRSEARLCACPDCRGAWVRKTDLETMAAAVGVDLNAS
jgi:Zn-finger nucleic acid-binding protein